MTIRIGNLRVKIDDEDIPIISAYTWYPSWSGKRFYIKAWYKGHGVYLHRVLCGAKLGEEVDHVNTDSLDNRKMNLRICSRVENAMNRGKVRRNTSGYKGVSWDRGWLSQIQFRGKHFNLGRYSTPEEAHLAYQKKARELAGDFARW